MSALAKLLSQAEDLLAQAERGSEHADRCAAFTDFMKLLERLVPFAREEAHHWGQANAERFARLHEELNAWELELAELLLGGGEEECEWALNRRSQHALARDLFRDTAADEMLLAYEDAEIDHALKEKADSCAIPAPDWAPRDHVWWHRPDETPGT